jgi:hypothetical protein
MDTITKLAEIKSMNNTGMVTLIVPGSTALSIVNQLCV